MGRDIVALKAEARWGSKFYKNLSRDLKEANPLATCFSPKNLLYMKNFYCMYLPYTEIGQQLADQLEKKDFSSQHRAKNSSFEINQQLADQLEKDIFSIPWGHHMLLIDKFLTVPQKERYLPMPDYDKSTATEVVLTLPGTVIDENYSLLLLENKNMTYTIKSFQPKGDILVYGNPSS